MESQALFCWLIYVGLLVVIFTGYVAYTTKRPRTKFSFIKILFIFFTLYLLPYLIFLIIKDNTLRKIWVISMYILFPVILLWLYGIWSIKKIQGKIIIGTLLFLIGFVSIDIILKLKDRGRLERQLEGTKVKDLKQYFKKRLKKGMSPKEVHKIMKGYNRVILNMYALTPEVTTELYFYKMGFGCRILEVEYKLGHFNGIEENDLLGITYPYIFHYYFPEAFDSSNSLIYEPNLKKSYKIYKLKITKLEPEELLEFQVKNIKASEIVEFFEGN